MTDARWHLTNDDELPRDKRQTSDEHLLAAARDRSDPAAARQAASDLLQRYHVRVFRWCRAQLGDADQAADVAQDVLVRAYRGLDGFAGQSRFSSWLFAIARNRCLDEMKRPRFLQDEDVGIELVDPAANPAEAHEQAATLADLEGFMARHLLPEEQEAMILRYVEHMPVAEITRTLGLTAASGARGVLQQARRKLQKILGTGGGLPDES